jgi:hypothetical protein
MNWLKACQACAQFGRFLNVTREAKKNPVDGAIVIFERFSGDWAGHARSRQIADGWDRWYDGYNEVDGKRVDLLMLCDGELNGYPLLNA